MMAEISFRTCLFVLLFCRMETCSVIKKETDPGFDLFFSSNLEEMTDVPIYFENPLPTWLHGTLVRFINTININE